jgi:hypothetical protein
MMAVEWIVRLTLCVALLAAAGCTPLAPWERGTLAKPAMALDPNSAQSAMRTHVRISREAASGGGATSGGGCGCN